MFSEVTANFCLTEDAAAAAQGSSSVRKVAQRFGEGLEGSKITWRPRGGSIHRATTTRLQQGDRTVTE